MSIMAHGPAGPTSYVSPSGTRRRDRDRPGTPSGSDEGANRIAPPKRTTASAGHARCIHRTQGSRSCRRPTRRSLPHHAVPCRGSLDAGARQRYRLLVVHLKERIVRHIVWLRSMRRGFAAHELGLLSISTQLYVSHVALAIPQMDPPSHPIQLAGRAVPLSPTDVVAPSSARGGRRGIGAGFATTRVSVCFWHWMTISH